MRTDCCVAASLYCGVLITEASQRFQTTRSNNASFPLALATMNSTPSVMITSMLAMRAGEKNVDRRINALVADLSIEHHFHVSGAFELLKDQLVHAAAGFN